MQKNQTALDRMIELSIEILKIKLLQTKVRHIKLNLNRLSFVTLTGKYIKHFEVELTHKRQEFENLIYTYAKKAYPEMLGFNETHAHFTLNELKRGYYILEDSNVLILSGDNKGELINPEREIELESITCAISEKDLQILTLLNAT